MQKATTNLDDEKARPRGDTGADDGGDVRPDVQGISNREGDVNDAHDEMDDPDDDAGWLMRAEAREPMPCKQG
jgi:hypothetical protein